MPQVTKLAENEESAFKDATSRLIAGLKSCHLVIDDYRSKLLAEREHPVSEDPEASKAAG